MGRREKDWPDVRGSFEDVAGCSRYIKAADSLASSAEPCGAVWSEPSSSLSSLARPARRQWLSPLWTKTPHS